MTQNAEYENHKMVRLFSTMLLDMHYHIHHNLNRYSCHSTMIEKMQSDLKKMPVGSEKHSSLMMEIFMLQIRDEINKANEEHDKTTQNKMDKLVARGDLWKEKATELHKEIFLLKSELEFETKLPH